MSADRPLRIAHVALTALPASVGGLEIVVDSLIRQQRAKGHHVALVTPWRQWRAARRAGRQNVLPLPPWRLSRPASFRNAEFPSTVALTARFYQLRHKFDVWHAHWIYPTAWLVQDALRKAGVPLVITAHGADVLTDPRTGHGFRLIEENDGRIRAVASKAHALTAISASIARTYLELGAQPASVQNIPNGVNVAQIQAAREYREQTRARYGIAPTATMILTVARNQPSKGLQFIPPMLRRLKASRRDVVWFIVGPKSEELAPMFEQAGVAEFARLLPKFGDDGLGRFPPQDLARLYAAADVFAFPSLSEGFGLVAIEAMAAGVPVVGNDVEGIRDVVSHEVDGLLCPPGDVDAMVRAICRIIDEPLFAADLAGAAVRKAEAHDWSTISDRYVALYRQLIDPSDRLDR
ncbi:MAG TPA: glycosyltransferase family 4 protein [Sphingomonadaceae bacterium]